MASGFKAELGFLSDWEARVSDITPVLGTVEARFNETMERNFKMGVGPNGAHRPLKPSTRRHHRTGTPWYNKGDLARCFTTPGAPGYRFDKQSDGWEHQPSHVALQYVTKRGDSLGIDDDDEQFIDAPIPHYLDTGEVLSS